MFTEQGPFNKPEHLKLPPLQPPTITGARSRYRRGEEVDLNCTVEATMPPANISWYINQRLVSAQKAREPLFINFRGYMREICEFNSFFEGIKFVELKLMIFSGGQ